MKNICKAFDTYQKIQLFFIAATQRFLYPKYKFFCIRYRYICVIFKYICILRTVMYVCFSYTYVSFSNMSVSYVHSSLYVFHTVVSICYLWYVSGTQQCMCTTIWLMLMILKMFVPDTNIFVCSSKQHLYLIHKNVSDTKMISVAAMIFLALLVQ